MVANNFEKLSLNTLPPELFQEICYYLSLDDLYNLFFSNKYMYNFVDSLPNSFWEFKTENECLEKNVSHFSSSKPHFTIYKTIYSSNKLIKEYHHYSVVMTLLHELSELEYSLFQKLQDEHSYSVLNTRKLQCFYKLISMYNDMVSLSDLSTINFIISQANTIKQLGQSNSNKNIVHYQCQNLLCTIKQLHFKLHHELYNKIPNLLHLS
jgi:hypothetical protein